ncbi:hypothetical protein AGMMS50268_10120 [Spirochaetia bacterium]|nr:hypothetical protein AGMMS50268_10120 [Spirochaetia bacterium]
MIDYSLLTKLYPGLAEELEKEDDPPSVEISVEKTASGVPSLVVNGLHIHSPRDPVREARRLAESLSADHKAPTGRSGSAGEGPAGQTGPIVILGFGLGYAAEAAANAGAEAFGTEAAAAKAPAGKAPQRPLIIVEKRRQVLKKALETRDLSKFLAENRIVFVVGGSGDAISGALSLFEDPIRGKAAPPLIRNRALMQLDEAWYANVEQRIKAWTRADDVNTATLRRFGKRWVRNLARNMEAIRDLPGISRLTGVLSEGRAAVSVTTETASHTAGMAGMAGIPVFLAAAGPSLDRIGPLLKEISRRSVIVAVDTSLRFILKWGVDPDFAVVVDPQYWNARHLDRSAAPRTHLIAESAVYPPVLRHSFRGSFLCGSLFPLGRFIEDRLDPKGDLGAGGSVATTAWDFARVLGAPSIWIAGLDLSFPELKTHFRGALFEDRSHAESGRRLPAETWSVRALRDGRPFLAPAAGGGQVLTDRRLSLYAAWFESRFREYPLVHNYSLSPGGLAIAGLETASAEQLLALPDRREEINQRLETLFEAISRDFKGDEALRQRAEQYEKARKSLLDGLEQIKTGAERAASLAKNALRKPAGPFQDKKEQEKLLKTLDKTLEEIKTSEVKDVAGFLFPPADELGPLNTGEAGTTGGAAAKGKAGEPDPFRHYLEFSAKTYRAIAEAAEYQLSALKRYSL